MLKTPNFSDNQDLIYFNELITFKKWQKIYKKYCNKEFKADKISFKEIFNTFNWIIFNFKEQFIN